MRWTSAHQFGGRTNAGGRIHIRCSVAVFSATGSPELAANQSRVIDVGFENAQTAQYLTCSTIQIAVQPVRFPQISADADMRAWMSFVCSRFAQQVAEAPGPA